MREFILVLLVVFWGMGSSVEGFNISFASTNEKDCSKQLNKVGDEICLAAHVKFPHGLVGSLLTNLEALDANALVRKLYIGVHLHEEASDTQDVDAVLDSFVTPRPWWMILSEDVAVHDESTKAFALHIFLIRITPRLEVGLRQLAEIQYPPSDQACHEIPLCVVRMVERGWGSQNMLIESRWSESPWQQFQIFDSRIGLSSEKALYPGAKFCPDKKNFRECIFLPMSNCSVPNDFATKHNCPQYNSECSASQFSYYANATSDGLFLGLNNPPESRYDTPYVKNVRTKYEVRGPDFKILRSSIFYDARSLLIKGDNWLIRPDAMSIVTNQGFLLRPAATVRRMVMRLVQKIRTEYQFALGTPCVTMHIRRGDRVYKGNITEYCRPYRRYDINGSCVNIERPSEYCGTGQYDYGCFAVNPYSSLRLTDYLSRAKTLQSSKTALVMTDDAAWLATEIAGLPAQWLDWKIINMGSHFDRHSATADEASPHVNYEYSTATEFLATLALGRQCQAFVGHFGSGLTVSFMHAFCFQHGLTSGQCPDMFDIGYAYDVEAGHQKWLPPMTILRS